MTAAVRAGLEPVIRAQALTKRYPGVTALDALTVDIQPGVVGLIGANGAGKSTLMKLLLGLIEPTSGTARVLGFDPTVDGLRVRERIGYLPEHDCLPTEISATRFVLHMARMSGLPVTHARKRTAEILRHVGLFEERHRPIGGYSTGMKQRVKLAQALVHDPQLLFLDEPTNGLDPSGRDDMLGLIERTGQIFGVSVIMSSHLLGEISSVCDALVVIDAGTLTRSGPVSSSTGLTSVLVVEVRRGLQPLLERLTQRGLQASIEGHVIIVRLPDGIADDDHTHNRAIVGAVAELDLPLVRLARRRRSLSEIFEPTFEAGARP